MDILFCNKLSFAIVTPSTTEIPAASDFTELTGKGQFSLSQSGNFADSAFFYKQEIVFTFSDEDSSFESVFENKHFILKLVTTNNVEKTIGTISEYNPAQLQNIEKSTNRITLSFFRNTTAFI